MAWITSVTDRTSSSYYNITDANRVDNNTRYLESYAESNLNFNITLDDYTTATVDTLPTVALINLLENNINTVRDGLTYDPLSWVTLLENWIKDTNDVFIYTNANNLETDLDLLKLNFEQINDGLRKCGTFNTGSKMTKL